MEAILIQDTTVNIPEKYFFKTNMLPVLFVCSFFFSFLSIVLLEIKPRFLCMLEKNSEA